MDANEIRDRIEAIFRDEKATERPPPVIRPALSPFDVELDEAHIASVAKEIEQLNVALAGGSRGYFDVPTGHANAIKANFEDARHAGDPRRWRVEIVSVNPTFAKIMFRADGDPPFTD